MDSVITPQTINFLQDLSKNNNRAWFNTHKERYNQARQNFVHYVDEVANRMSEFDHIEGNKAKIFRIYRDVRFSKDKTPYKINFSASMARATKQLRGGYYFMIGADEDHNIVGGGFYQPNKEDLYRIRQAIAYNGKELKDILSTNRFKNTFGSLQGQQLKTAPKDFSRDHKEIALLRYKSFYVYRKYSFTQVLSDDFVDMTVTTFRALRPFFDYMSNVLTTNANGESIE